MRRQVEFLGLTLFFAVCLAAAFLGGYYTRAWSAAVPQFRWSLPGLPQETEYTLLSEARSLIEQHFNGTLPPARQLEYGAVRGYVNAIGDPYTVFVEPPAAEIESDNLQGEYGGVGVEIARNAAGEITLRPFPDSPAAAAGIQAGDVLLQVDGTALTAATTTDDAAALIRGLVGTEVALTVRHPDGATETVRLTRRAIAVPSVTGRMVDGQPDMGLLTVSRFSEKTPDELRRAAAELEAQGARRFILDLRNNGGGLLDSAVKSAGLFLDGGTVMIEAHKDGSEKTYTAPAEAGLLATAPVVVLVNGGTASAAEILAGALLDRDRASLIGQKTFGKGSVQFVFPLSDGSSLHVTANRWFTPARRQLDRQGLPPTIEVQPATDGTDAELARAVDYLNNGR